MMGWKHAWLRFCHDRLGAVTPLLGISMIALTAATGVAVDLGRAGVAKARLVSALDAAGLAVGARVTTSDAAAEARRYVLANFASGYAGATIGEVTATVSSDKKTISLTASATLPTAFMKLVGTKTIGVSAATEITRSTTGMELALVLDTTGSMSGSMNALKSAANSLVDTLFGSDTVADNLFVSVVPFSQAVNIGTSRSTWVNFNNNKKANWKGCVMARDDGLDQTDQPPSSSSYKFEDYYYPYYGGSLYCPSELQPLTNVKSTVKSAISSMSAAGNTHINLGAVWGWRALSPSWRGYWGSLSWEGVTVPLAYDTDKMEKVVVLMTDGDNTMSSLIYTAYQYLKDKKLGTTSASAAEKELDSRLSTVCTAMKQQGIIVYTVAFNDPSNSTKSLMQNCATMTSYYFDAGNSAALATAFATIGDALSNLRVSK